MGDSILAGRISELDDSQRHQARRTWLQSNPDINLDPGEVWLIDNM